MVLFGYPNIRCRIILRIQEGTIILTTTYMSDGVGTGEFNYRKTIQGGHNTAYAFSVAGLGCLPKVQSSSPLLGWC